MAVDAPDPKAQALAAKLSGKSPEAQVMDMLVKSATTGDRDEDGRPVKDEPISQVEEEDDEEFTPDEEEEGDDESEEIESDEEEIESDDDEEEGDDEEQDGDDSETVEYSDEDTLEVTVDGKTESVNLRELKRVYSLHQATEKRLQEATEARKAANVEREKAAEEAQTYRSNMLKTIQQLDGVLFAPLVKEPDPSLRSKNMQEYLMAKDAYDEDQKRIKSGREQLGQFLAEEQNKLAGNRQQFRQKQQEILVEKLPALTDPEKAGKVQKSIMDAAHYYGFSPEQVAQVDHHGLFLMAYDAARWLNMQKLKQNGVPMGGEKDAMKLTRKRKLKSGGATSTKLRIVKQRKEQQAAEAKAQKSGRVDDVTAMLISKAHMRNRNHGRSG